VSREDDLKARQRRHWDDVAGGWAARAAWTDRNFAPLTGWLHASGCWRTGSMLLDVACGSGYPVMAAASAIGESGRIVAIDISPRMLAVVAGRAREVGSGNIEFVEMDAESLQFDDRRFDAVTNTYGLMFCPDVSRAVAEMYRVVRDGGPVAVVVWDDPRSNPYFEVLFTAGASLLDIAPPEAGQPGPFRLASREALAALLQGAGFHDVTIDRLAMTFECQSVDDYVAMFGELAMKSRLAKLTADNRERLRAAVSEAARPYLERDGRLLLPTTSLCAVARK
jgi:SAM-dependent methyltransferase